jgi:ATP-dependent RNA helicase DDX3X
MAINCFTKGEIPILIATDVASRGLDFPNIPYVINYDLPSNIDDYIHRIGRTGRCGNAGTAISFINENCRITKDLYKLLKKSNQPVPDWFEDLNNKAEYTFNKKPYSSYKSHGNSGSGYNQNKFGYSNGFDIRKGENFRGNEDSGSGQLLPRTFFNSSLNSNPSNFNSTSNYNSSDYSNTNKRNFTSNGGFGNSNPSGGFNNPHSSYGGGNANTNSSRNYFGEEKFARRNYDN